MRGIGIVLGMLLAGFSSARIMLDTRFQNDPRMIRVSGRLLVSPEEHLSDFAKDQRDKETAEGSKAAVEFSLEALKRNDASPFRWCDLGFSLLASGHQEEARYCFERALKLGPNLISILARAADFYKSIDEPRRALRCTSRILELAPSYSGDILATYASSQYNLADTLNYGLPDDPAIAASYFRVLLRAGERDAIDEAWKWLAARSIPGERLANEYVDFLMRARAYDQALATWLSRLGERKGDYLVSEFAYNGGFESEPCGSVFDWRISRAAGVEAARDPGVARSGAWSLRVVFGGSDNVGYRHVSQDVIVNPGNYRFKAYVRTQDVTTDQGIAFRIYDPDAAARLNIRTEQLAGTNDWTEIAADVPVPEGTRRIRIELVRSPSKKFDNRIRGTAWIDGVTLTKYE